MGNPRIRVVLACTVVFLISGASPAFAHGGHDAHRIASGTAGGFEVHVWTEESGFSEGVMSLSIGLTKIDENASIDTVAVYAVTADGSRIAVDTIALPDGFWVAEVPTMAEGSTTFVVAIEGANGGVFEGEYTPPSSSIVMKTIVQLALALGLVSSYWLLTRRRRAFTPQRAVRVPDLIGA